MSPTAFLKISGRAHRRRRSGFTMIEVALSLGVLAIALVAIIGILPTGLRVQQENRQDTILAQDGMLLLESIRTGREVADRRRPVTTRAPDWPNGYDYLTNSVLAVGVSNHVDGVVIHANPYLQGPRDVYPFGRLGPLAPDAVRWNLTNGLHIIGLLGRPKLEMTPAGPTTNYIAALVRSISGPAAEKGTVGRDLAFTYLLTSEVVPLGNAPRDWVDYGEPGLTEQEILTRSNRFLVALNQGGNFRELRLTINGPVYPTRDGARGLRWSTYGSPRVFRTIVSGRQFAYRVQDDPQFVVSYFLPGDFQRIIP